MDSQVLQKPNTNTQKTEDSSSPLFISHKDPSEAKLALDVFETGTDLILLAPLSGIYVEEVEVLLTEDVLTISGKRVFPDDIVPEKSKAFLEECYWGGFSRSIVLPAAVNSEDATAEFIRGILTIRIPKAKKVKSKVIPIKIA